MRISLLIVAALLLWPRTGSTQLSVREQQSPDRSSWRAEIHVNTSDRSFVPLTMESRTTKADDKTTRTETVTRTRMADGSYFESQRDTTLTEKLGSGAVQTTTQTVEVDREGRARTTGEIRETTTRTATGEKTDTTTLRRNSSGQLVPDRQTETTTVRNPDGTLSRQRVEQGRDVNGNAVVERNVQETVRTVSPAEQTVTAVIRSPDHLTGQLAATAREETTIRTEANTTHSERTISEPRGAGWQVSAKVVSTETKAPDGSIQRDTIRYAMPRYSESQPTAVEPLEPKLKIEERLVNKPDGTQVLQREVYVRDVNGQWKAPSFSTSYQTDVNGRH